MIYSKQPLLFSDQIKKLNERGLKFNDEDKATHYLSNISYYRLRAYTYPFQDNIDPDHPFTNDVSFEEIIDLYVFDRRLRLLVFNAIEKIEIALRTKIIYYFSLSYGSHFHENPELYRNPDSCASGLVKLYKEIDRSTEDFIKHYYDKYTDPENPPAWMSLEVASIGILSHLYEDLKLVPEKKQIAKEFGLPDVKFLESWMHAFSNLRNTCAHHSRIWNRRFVAAPKLPNNTTFPFLVNKTIHTNKLYASLCCIQYILKIISPNSSFCTNLINLMNHCPLNQSRAMGFPSDWKTEKLWS